VHSIRYDPFRAKCGLHVYIVICHSGGCDNCAGVYRETEIGTSPFATLGGGEHAESQNEYTFKVYALIAVVIMSING